MPFASIRCRPHPQCIDFCALRFTGSAPYDEDTNHILYNRDIEDSLKSALQGKKLDLISFDACLMSMLETAYAMRDVGSFFVGSEEEEPGQGWNYQRLLSSLVANPDFSPADVGSLIVSSYADEYGNAPSRTTMAALDQSKIPALAALTGAFASTIQSPLNNDFASFKAARVRTKGYGASPPTKVSIDLASFVHQLALTYTSPELRVKAQQLEELVSQAVVKSYASSDMKSLGSNGIAIFFPASAADFDADPNSSGYSRSNTLFPIEFVNDEAWSDLVQSYVAHDRQHP